MRASGSHERTPSRGRTFLRGLRLFPLVAALILVLAACTNDGDGGDSEEAADGGPVEVTLWFARDYIPPDNFESLEEEHNIRVTYDIRPDDNEMPTMLEMREAGEELPDLVEFDSHRTPFGIETDLLQPMTEYIERFEEEDPELYSKVLPSTWEEGTFDGDIYHVAWTSSFDLLYYNADILEEAGVEAPLETWFDVLEAARAIKETHPELSQTFGSGVTSHDLLWYWLIGFGVPMEGNIPDLTSEQGLEFIEWAQTLFDEELINPEFVIGEQDEAQGAFIREDGAILQDGVNAGLDYMEVPDFEYESGWLSMPLPVNEGGEHINVPRGWSLSAESEHPYEATLALRYLMETENALPRYLLGSSTPRSTDVLEAEEVAEAQPYFTDEIKDAFMDVSLGIPSASNTLEVGEILIELRDTLLVEGTDESPQEVADRFQPMLDEMR